MRKILFSILISIVLGISTSSADERKGSFALTLQGGGLWELGEDDFGNAVPLLNAGLEYYLFEPLALGSQLSFAQARHIPPCYLLCVGCCPEYTETDQLFQTYFYLRFVEVNHTLLKFFILAGPTINHVRQKSLGVTQAAGSDGIEPVDNPIGAKLGIGLFIHFSRNWAFNLTTAMDTKPEIFSSATGGLTVFLPTPNRKGL